MLRIFLSIVWVIALTGCATQHYQLGPNHTTPTLQPQQFIASDNTPLPLQVWQPKTAPQAQVIILHGFNEYSGAFDRVGQYFAEQGVKAWAYDQRGFGRGAQIGLWAGGERMAQDAREFVHLVHADSPSVPLYLLGASMGGAVVLQATAKHPNLPLQGIILEAPGVWARSTQPYYQRWALAITRRVTPSWSPTGKGLKIRASDNDTMLREIWQSPYMIRKSRIDTLAGVVDLMDMAYASAVQVPYPVLLLYGLKDQVIPHRPVKNLWQRLPKAHSSAYVEYQQGWHMLTRDLQGERVMQDVLDWIGVERSLRLHFGCAQCKRSGN